MVSHCGRACFAGHHDVDVIAAAQAVVKHREQAVRIGRQVDPHDIGLLVDDMIEEPGILMGEAVVILLPHVRGQQIVERGNRPPPGQFPAHLEPLRVLTEHRVDDANEGLVAVEKPVASGQ